jgi:hypothetical protein
MFSATGAALAQSSLDSTFQLAQASSPSPASGDDPNLFHTDSNNRGKFFLNDVPDGRMILTVTAPGYRSLTLLPGVSHGQHSLVAFVMDEDQRIKQMGVISDIPISDKSLKVKTQALPDTSSPAPTAKPSPLSVDELIKPVEEMLSEPDEEASPAASASPESAEPDSSPTPKASVKPKAKPSPKATPAPAESPEAAPPSEENEETETPDKGFNLLEAVTELVTGEKPKAGETDDTEIYPVIPLRSVLSETVLAGTVDVPEGYVAKNLEIYLTLPPAKKGEVPQEVYLFSQPLQDAAPEASASPAAAASAAPAAPAASQARFRTLLPNLEKNHAYHLQLTAAKEGGETTYHHLYNLGKSDEALKVQFMSATPKIEIEGEERNAIPTVPGFGWSAVSGAEIYHVTLEAGARDERRIIWEAWTKNTELKFPLSSRAQRLRENQSYTISVEALKGLGPAATDQKKQYALPSYRAIWTDLARFTHAPFEVVE